MVRKMHQKFIVTIFIGLSLISLGVYSANRIFDENSGVWVYEKLFGPWTIGTLGGDEKGYKLLILSRENWGNISLSGPGWPNDKSEIMISKQGSKDPSGGIVVIDSNNDGVFDVVQLTSSNPKFNVFEVRCIEGEWVMKSVKQWGGANGE